MLSCWLLVLVYNSVLLRSWNYKHSGFHIYFCHWHQANDHSRLPFHLSFPYQKKLLFRPYCRPTLAYKMNYMDPSPMHCRMPRRKHHIHELHPLLQGFAAFPWSPCVKLDEMENISNPTGVHILLGVSYYCSLFLSLLFDFRSPKLKMRSWVSHLYQSICLHNVYHHQPPNIALRGPNLDTTEGVKDIIPKFFLHKQIRSIVIKEQVVIFWIQFGPAESSLAHIVSEVIRFPWLEYNARNKLLWSNFFQNFHQYYW